MIQNTSLTKSLNKPLIKELSEKVRFQRTFQPDHV